MERCQVRTNLFLYLNLHKFVRESLEKEKQNKNQGNLIFTVIKKLVVYVSFSKEQSIIYFYVQGNGVLIF
jgi:hypothetical protein